MKAFKEGQEQRIRQKVSQMLESELGRDSSLRSAISDSGDMYHVVNIGTSILCTKW